MRSNMFAAWQCRLLRVYRFHYSRCRQEGSNMRQFLNSVTTFLKSDDGPTSVEYCVMFAFILLVCFAAIGELGATTHELYTDLLEAIE
jgi:pilus assembly protein Flp/PilA